MKKAWNAQDIKPIPGRIKEGRQARGYNVNDFAEAIGVSRQSVSAYELGQSIPRDSTMAKIMEVLNLPLTFFLKPYESGVTPYEPVTFFRALKSAPKRSKEMIIAKSDWLEERVYLYLNKFMKFPEGKLLAMAERFSEEYLDEEEIETIAELTRKELNLGMGPIEDLTFVLEEQGVIISRIEFGDPDHDACSQWRSQRPFIFLGADKQSAARNRFNLAHELGHLLLHLGVDQEMLSNKVAFNHVEKQANRFASALLMPRESFCSEVISTSLDHFISLKKRWNVSIAAMIYRCESLGILTNNQALYLRKQLARNKMNIIEPLDDVIQHETPVMFKQAVEMLLENNVVTPSDIVEAISLPPKEIEELCSLTPGTLVNRGKVISLELKRGITKLQG